MKTMKIPYFFVFVVSLIDMLYTEREPTKSINKEGREKREPKVNNFR